MKILTTRQIREADQFTIRHEPVASLDLMERAANRLVEKLHEMFPGKGSYYLFCGPGNNGGDGLAVARILLQQKHEVQVYILDNGFKFSEDCGINLNRFRNIGMDRIHNIRSSTDFPDIPADAVIIDAIFGSGLTRPVDGPVKELIRHLNSSPAFRIALDIPSGLMGEDNSGNDPDAIVRANHTLTLQCPKLSFMLAGNFRYTGSWEWVDIGLHRGFMDQVESPFTLTGKQLAKRLLRPRPSGGHKGSFGHVMLVSGSYGKMGAAVLAAKAAVHSGAGLVTALIPGRGYDIMQTAVPEAMVLTGDSDHDLYVGGALPDLHKYQAIGVGPGITTEDGPQRLLRMLLQEAGQPLVLDADALNILAIQKTWISFLPPNTILTPHPGEFDRLTGEHRDGYSRLMTQVEFSKKHGVIVVLKGANTSITSPSGNVWFNSTGNSGMATGGTGDVLTGLLTGLCAQGYTPLEAAIFGVYLHGLAGDLATAEVGEQALSSSTVCNFIGKAFLVLAN